LTPLSAIGRLKIQDKLLALADQVIE